MKHKEFQLSQKVIFYKESTGEVLLLKLNPKDEPNFYKKYGPWDLPGGRVAEGEEVSEALARELREEIGNVEYTLGEAVHSIAHASTIEVPVADESASPYRVVIYYLAKYQKGDITLSSEHREFVWKKPEDVIKDKDCKPWLKEAVEAARERIQSSEYLSHLKRVTADFENYKKRQASEKDELGRYMVNTVVTELIPILDNFHMAVEHVPEDKKNDPWVTGITYIEKQFEEVLARYGVKVLEVKAGEKFDPTRHEAIEHNEKENAKELVIEKVRQKGYEMNGKVIRPAKVNVMSK